MSKKAVTTYLVGGMEHANDLGAGWRDKLTPSLLELGLSVLNPCEFEPEQLKGLHVNRLPDKIITDAGKIIHPEHWHHLKYAPRGSAEQNRFIKYMQQIIDYDLNVVENEADFLICNWTKGAAKGAGTHSEITLARKLRKPIYLVLEKGVELPGWTLGCVGTNVFDNFDDLLVKLKTVK